MSCCSTFDFQVQNQVISTVAYTDDIKQQLGPYPRVTVMHYDAETDSYKNAEGVQIVFDGSTIIVDHGGPVNGIIKLS